MQPADGGELALLPFRGRAESPVVDTPGEAGGAFELDDVTVDVADPTGHVVITVEQHRADPYVSRAGEDAVRACALRLGGP